MNTTISSDKVDTILQDQKSFFLSGETRSLSFRIEQLKKLKTALSDYKCDILEALNKDLNRPIEEGLLEIYAIKQEVNLFLNKLEHWMRPKRVRTPFLLFPSKSAIYYEPYGLALIISPWNGPFSTTFLPLIGSMGTGNCTLVKPSEISSNSETVIYNIINSIFPSHYIYCFKADAANTQNLLHKNFDFIFYTGNPRIGRIVMKAAAERLTPCLLELGGKSPCIIDESADLDLCARRITMAKFLNAGQICVAPDYLYIHASKKEQLVNKLKATIRKFYGENIEDNLTYGKIINYNHFQRLIKLMNKGRILYGGQCSEKKLSISPTLIDQVGWQDPIMQEEIFGPILPILTFENIQEVITTVNTQPKPLALYLFSNNKKVQKQIIDHISFGGGCINDCLMHLLNPNLPIGGIGESGLGAYTGKFSFEAFSHRKPILSRNFPYDPHS